MSEDKTAVKLDASERLAAQDEMFTIRQNSNMSEYDFLTINISFRETLIIRLHDIELFLREDGWPPLWGRVTVHGDDGNEWEEIPSEIEVACAADDIDPHAEVLDPQAPTQIELGANFIRRRLTPLTPKYWLFEEALAIRQALDAKTVEEALAAGHALGTLHERAHLHSLHLAAVTTGRGVRVKLKGSREKATLQAQAIRDHRRQRVRELVSMSSRTGGALINFILNRLSDEGIKASRPTIYRDLKAIEHRKRR